MSRSIVKRPVIGAGLLLLIPLFMTFVDRAKPLGQGWRWGIEDFAIMFVLLAGAGIAYEFGASKIGSQNKRIILGAVVILAVLAIWAQLAVGAISKLFA